MSHGHASSIRDFLRLHEDTLIGRLVDGVASTGIGEHRTAQVEAWRRQIRLLKTQMTDAAIQDWFIVLEYELPRRARRPDVVILSPDTIFVVEFKMGACKHDAAARWQVVSYALDLRDFHAASAGRSIVPILCATGIGHAWRADDPSMAMRDGRGPILSNGSDLGAILRSRGAGADRAGIVPIDPGAWLGSAYRPTPTIIEAAVRLYEGHGVRELSHRHAHNLDRTTAMLVGRIDEARRNGQRLICFVTGVPGAGKTLTGLDVVHDPGLRHTRAHAGVFLSGNGPLVKIVREALVRSRVAAGGSRRECEREITTFIQNVHQFLRFYRDRPVEKPHEHVVVFDEAQRAWNRAQMSRKQGVDASEADLLLGVMERLPDWAVIIALVGGGQEIYLGEAGLEEWGLALEGRTHPWRVVASPEVLTGADSVAGHRLFTGTLPAGVTFEEEPSAHLDVVVRSHRAQRWAEWVNELLHLRVSVARHAFPDGREFPCFVTRDLAIARAWLRHQKAIDPDLKTGLVATSEDLRLRAYGIEASSAFRMDFAFEKWFLAPDADIRSSSRLEVAASEFECQGLELDWICMGWGGDLVPLPDRSDWEHRKFRGTRWQSVRQEQERAYVRNRYRVLLTRARRGLIVWVPPGSVDDPTLDPVRFDRVYELLREAGIPDLEEVSA